eukprot:gene17645-biopygen11095
MDANASRCVGMMLFRVNKTLVHRFEDIPFEEDAAQQTGGTMTLYFEPPQLSRRGQSKRRESGQGTMQSTSSVPDQQGHRRDAEREQQQQDEEERRPRSPPPPPAVLLAAEPTRQRPSLAHLATPLNELRDAQKRSLAILEQSARRRSSHRSVEQRGGPADAERGEQQQGPRRYLLGGGLAMAAA